MNVLEQYRGLVVSSLHKIDSFARGWPERRDVFRAKFRDPKNPQAREIYDLGDHLASAFRLNIRGREQSDLSGGGKAWESLVIYYLNLGFAGSNAVAIPSKKEFIPESILNATTISYQNNQLRSDLDVVVFSCPELMQIPQELDHNKCTKRVRETVNENFQKTSVINIQCKTNWNDNAQIPMLWNHIFSLARNNDLPTKSGYIVGSNGFNIGQLVNFFYSFVTVPTNKLSCFKPTSMPVYRMRNISGGYFWGHKSKKQVCQNIKEFYDFHHNRTPSHFPDPSAVGVGISSEVKLRSGNVDVHAFDLF